MVHWNAGEREPTLIGSVEAVLGVSIEDALLAARKDADGACGPSEVSLADASLAALYAAAAVLQAEAVQAAATVQLWALAGPQGPGR